MKRARRPVHRPQEWTSGNQRVLQENAHLHAALSEAEVGREEAEASLADARLRLASDGARLLALGEELQALQVALPLIQEQVRGRVDRPGFPEPGAQGDGSCGKGVGA